MSKNDTDIANYKKQLDKFGPAMREIEIRMEKRQDTILEVREKRNTVEDRIFAGFCEQIGVDNIRYVILSSLQKCQMQFEMIMVTHKCNR